MLKTLVIDNEYPIRQTLINKLELFPTIITEIHEADGVESGKKAIHDYQPDLVFLDVEMGDGTGFDLLTQLSEINFQLIFITAHDKYAITAFRMNAIDFLLKPIDLDDLETAILKAQKNSGVAGIEQQLEYLKQSLSELNPKNQRIILKDMKSIYFVKIAEIIRCESEASYTTFFLSNAPKITISRSLKEFEQLLEPFGFIRPHNSHLVNKEKIMRIDKSDGGWIVLEDDTKIPVSQRRWDNLLKELK